jgi:hypothetical protein
MKTRDLEKLKSKLPKRWTMILWQRLNIYSIKDIKNALNGDFKGDSSDNIIIEAAVRLAQETEAKNRILKEKINSL